MARLVFSAIESLDGYVADEAGKFDFAERDESGRTFANDLQLQGGTCLHGRRIYEVMVALPSGSIRRIDRPAHGRLR